MAEDLVITPNNPFSTESWSETAPVIVENDPPKPPAATIPPVLPTTPVLEPEKELQGVPAIIKNDFLKKMGFDSEETAEREIPQLMEKAKWLEFTNEESRKVFEYIRDGKEDEVYKFLDSKKKIEKLSTADLSNKDIAMELVKFGIQKDNPTLNEDEVDFLFNEKYSLPVKPVQGDELDEEYDQRLNNWKSQIESVEKRLVIEAKMTQPKMAQLKTELVLPDIPRQPEVQDPVKAQEELQKISDLRNGYLQSLEKDYSKFTGYETKYKDEEVEIPVSFVVPEEEKIALKTELENFDIDKFISERWFPEGKPNAKQLMEDVTLLRKKEAVFQKIANEVGSKMKEHYIGIKTNVSVNGSQQNTHNTDNAKSNMDKQIEHIWTTK